MKNTLGCLLLLAAACGTVADDDTDVYTAASSSSPVIATVGPNGAVVVNMDVLRPTFYEGGAIADFTVRQLIDGTFLVRRGHTLDGKTRTDTIPLARIANRYYLAYELHSIMICLGGCTFCGVTYNHNSCECPNGSDCDTGFIDLTPIEILRL
jgi:hypothetical protein